MTKFKCETCEDIGFIYRSGGVAEYNEMKEIRCPDCRMRKMYEAAGLEYK